jgi:GNAT superfamily N-acetyltransferase
MHTDFHVRICREEDLALLDRIIPCSEKESLHARRYADQRRGRNVYLLARLGDTSVGHLDLRWQATAAPMVTHVYLTGYAELKAIVVVPEHRGQGIGTRLIATAEQIAAARGFRTACIAVDVKNARARALYERLGYQDWGHGVVEVTWTVTDSNGRETHYRGLDIYLVKELRDEDVARAPAIARSVPVSVFGLSEDQLRPIVEAAVGKPIASFEITCEHQVLGYYGNASEKLIPTFTYVTAAGRRDRITMFVKHAWEARDTGWDDEATQYRFLSAHGAPVPRCYGLVRSPEEKATLFLEYVDGGDAAGAIDNDEQRLEFFSLMARFNAIRPSSDYAAWLEQFAWRQRDDLAGRGELVEAIWEDASRGDLGEDLKQCCVENAAKRARLRDFAEQTAAQVAAMELGLVHSDFKGENTGRRWGNRERVVLDIGETSLQARFFDISPWLGRPDEQWPAPPYPPREALAEHYLRAYARWGGPTISLVDLLAETRLFWLHSVFGLMSFGHNAGHANSGAIEDFRDGCRKALLYNLRMVLEGYC